MSNIKFKLNLNKHPKDCEDYSLIQARNIRVSDDFSCLQSEESIVPFPSIDISDTYKLVGVIPCNTEIILFVVNKDSYSNLSSENPECSCILFRYNEKTNTIQDYQPYQGIPITYHKGKIKGTFTYNVNNELIIAFSEYDALVDVPLKTINLGVAGTKEGADYTSDFNFDGKSPISPEIVIPRVSSFDYVSGSSYKGWYYYFIRYKINEHDYTQWYPIGSPIFICTLKLQNIFKYGLKSASNEYILNGASDHFSDNNDIANESIKLNIQSIDTHYNNFQIGFVCAAKDYSKAFRTSDISTKSVYTYEMKISECFEDSVNDLILATYNYYNVKNIINYKNRLYISNYKEKKDPDISKSELDKIRLSLHINTLELNDIQNNNIDVDSNGRIINGQIIKDYIPANPTLYYIWNNHEYKVTAQSGKVLKGVPTSAWIVSSGGHTYNATISINGSNLNLEFTINNITYAIVISLIAGAWIITINSFTDIIDLSQGDDKIYINTNNSFNERKLKNTLIPGETYNFYIHFVDKYGEVTKGYKLNNNVSFKISGSDSEYFPVYIGDGRNNTSVLHTEYSNCYLLVPKNTTFTRYIFTTFKLGYNPQYDLESNSYIFSEADDRYTISIQDAIDRLHIPDTLRNKTNLKWYDILSTSLINEELDNYPFSYAENNNGDSLFKVPELDIISTYNVNICSLNFDLNGFEIPEGYVGYYFSYEKFEHTKKITGILTIYDIFEQASCGGVDPGGIRHYKNYNIRPGTYIPSFYSSRLDIDDELDLDYNFIFLDYNYKIEDDNSSPYYTSGNKEILSGQYPTNYNKIEVLKDIEPDAFNKKYFVISDYSLNKANNILDGRYGVGTALNIKFSTDEINQIFTGGVHYVRATLLKVNKNIYTNENKTLIKFTNIFDSNTTSEVISTGLNGHITYQGTLIYNFNKFIMSAENVILTENYRSYYPVPLFADYIEDIGNIRPPVAYLQQICYDDIFYETKSFKNYPQQLTQIIDEVTGDDEKLIPFTINSIITPANSIDLFRELYTNQDKLNPKTYLAKSENESYVYQFDKRIQRSNVISDESFANSWRRFPVEGYKDISENKGKITNLIGIGTNLIAHTEHSLFAFDRNNTLQTADDENIKLAMPDIFDVDYKEIFTSDKGMCGLQDDKAFIVGQFGYIFYDNDAHRFYKFGEGKVEQIDFSIVQFLNTYTPYNVRFAHDKERNRILINFYTIDYRKYYTDEDAWFTLSYNYVIKEWISFHDYRFSEAYNTKNMLYLFEGLNELYANDDIIKQPSRVYCILLDYNKYLRTIISDSQSTRMLYNSFGNDGTNRIRRMIPYEYDTDQRHHVYPVKLSIIVHGPYIPIKTLEYLTYKLFRRGGDNYHYKDDYYNNIGTEIDREQVPYSGFELRVFNKEVDTGLIDVAIDAEVDKNTSVMNYKKPWWELDNWNFNYLRDIKQGSGHDSMARLYGNYFVIQFDLLNVDAEDNDKIKQKLEFEDLDVTLITDKTV